MKNNENRITSIRKKRLIKIIEFLKKEFESGKDRSGGNFCYIQSLTKILENGSYTDSDKIVLVSLDKIYIHILNTGETPFLHST